jgi:hypothetical protein
LLRSARGEDAPCHVYENDSLWAHTAVPRRAGGPGSSKYGSGSRHRSWETCQPVMLRARVNATTVWRAILPDADGIQLTSRLLSLICLTVLPLPSSIIYCMSIRCRSQVCGWAIIYFQGQIQRKHYNVFTAEAREAKRRGYWLQSKPEAYVIHEDWYRCVKEIAQKPA